MNYLTVDFGSTFTKLTAICSDKKTILGTSNSFTTITTDIMDGYRSALKELEQKVGCIDYDKTLCCSSAGGGLKMIALGLVPELTAKAARMAASSAGAKVVRTYSFEISQAEQEEISNIEPDLILLCGGTNGGNKEVIISNAQKLCEINKDFSIIVAGNKSASSELEKILKTSDKDYVITDNVMPSFNKLNIEPAKSCIRDLFIKKIIDAKGLTKAQAMASNTIIPTPLAVMTACELFSKGTKKTEGIGELVAIDLGGATTDIYSMATGAPHLDNVVEKGLPEAYSKRTVEGDLGMRYSLKCLFDEIDLQQIGNESQRNSINSWVLKCTEKPYTLAKNEEENKMEEFLARSAVEIAVERHCGILESVYSPLGEIFSLNGKDLTNIPYVIGIGGAIINSENPQNILEGAKASVKKYNYMKPKDPEYMLDKKYIFASMGLLSFADSELALSIMKQEIQKI